MQNIRSVRCSRNFDSLLLVLSRLNFTPDLIVLTECWLVEDMIPIQLDGYKFNCSKKYLNQNDGIIIYSKIQLNITIQEPDFLDASCLMVNIENIITLISIYRSPSMYNIDNFLTSLDSVISNTKSTHTIILGDINIDIKPFNKDSRSDSYLNLITMHGFYPTHTYPTHENNCIDHTLIKSQCKPETIVCSSKITDHDSVILTLDCRLQNNVRNMKKYMKRVDYDKLYAILSGEEWTNVVSEDNIDIATNNFIQKITDTVDSCTVTVNIPHRKQFQQPWITPNLLRCIRKRDRLHQKCKKRPKDNALKQTYYNYRNYCNNLLQNLKNTYNSEKLVSNSSNPKKQWSIIKNICHITENKSSSNKLLYLNKESKKDSLNLVNNYFTSVGRNLANTLLQKNHQTEQRLAEACEGEAVLQSFFLRPTNSYEIAKLIDNLKTDSSSGWDNITPEILKNTKTLILKPLEYIFNLSIKNGSVPMALKKSCICPIHKGGDPEEVSNYRPISLLSVIAKLLEKIINSRLVSYLEKNQILPDNQYGFRAGRSTEDAVNYLVNHIAESMDKKQKCIGVFLDLAKAFDTVSIPILLSKLNHIGVRGLPWAWFKSYLSDRRQYVKISEDVTKSECSAINFGVPQGSVLGPTLFLIYISTLGKLHLENSKIFTFADDTAIVFNGNTWKDAYQKAEKGMAEVADWLNSNLLTLNVGKTKFLGFHITKKTEPTQDHLTIHTCGKYANPPNINPDACDCTSIERTDKIKYLGVMLDHKLSWKPHIEVLSKRVRRLMYTFRCLRKVATRDLLKSIYLALCQSVVSYCIIAWGGAPKTTLISLERAQRAVIKVMYCKRFRFPTTQLYEETKLLTVRQQFLKSLILYFHRKSLQTIYSKENARLKKWLTPKTNTEFYKRFYNFLAPFVYTKVEQSHCIFKKTRFVCKKIINSWLLTLNYDDTEKVIKVNK